MNQCNFSPGSIIAAVVLVSIIEAAPAAPNLEPAVEDSNPEIATASQTMPNAGGAAGGHTAREQDIARRLSLAEAYGEVRWLKSANENFLAMYRESYQAIPHGGLIINIWSGGIVDSRPLHQNLARIAAAAGWAVLSIQPAPSNSTLSAEEKSVEENPRLDAAYEYLVAMGVQNIVVLGDAEGAIDAMSYIVGKASPAISGFVGLGKWDARLEETDIPILDIAGTLDRGAIALKEKRKTKYRHRGTRIEQLEIDGAGPTFYGYEDQVAKRIRGWLERVTPGVAVLQR